jgi:hypothetical protein
LNEAILLQTRQVTDWFILGCDRPEAPRLVGREIRIGLCLCRPGIRDVVLGIRPHRPGHRAECRDQKDQEARRTELQHPMVPHWLDWFAIKPIMRFDAVRTAPILRRC